MVVLLLSGFLHCHDVSKRVAFLPSWVVAFHLGSPAGFHCFYMAGFVAG